MFYWLFRLLNDKYFMSHLPMLCLISRFVRLLNNETNCRTACHCATFDVEPKRMRLQLLKIQHSRLQRRGSLKALAFRHDMLAIVWERVQHDMNLARLVSDKENREECEQTMKNVLDSRTQRRIFGNPASYDKCYSFPRLLRKNPTCHQFLYVRNHFFGQIGYKHSVYIWGEW